MWWMLRKGVEGLSVITPALVLGPRPGSDQPAARRFREREGEDTGIFCRLSLHLVGVCCRKHGVRVIARNGDVPRRAQRYRPQLRPFFLFPATNAFHQSAHAPGPLHALGAKSSMIDVDGAHVAAHAFISPLLNAATAPLIAAITPLVSAAELIAGTDKSTIVAVSVTMTGLQIFKAFSSRSRLGERQLSRRSVSCVAAAPLL